MTVLLGVYAALVAGLIAGELSQTRLMQLVFKPLAAFAFCYIALKVDGSLTDFTYPNYGLLIIAALIACAIGDVLLLSRSDQHLFQGGMAAFAIGHLIYAYAFYSLGLNMVWAVAALILFGAVSVLSYRHFAKTLAPDMRASVITYNIIITAMVVTAFGTQNPMIITGALMFAASDIVVGQDRFVRRDPRHALLISPLYFGAQVVFALSIANL